MLVGVTYYFAQRRSPALTQTAAPASTGPTLQDLQITQLTTSGNADQPAMSPDGKYVVYVQHDGNSDSLWIRQTATSSNVQIVAAEPGVELRGATVTPDGGYVDFVRGQRRLMLELWRVPFLGGTPKRIIDNIGSLVGWSPDDRSMAFVRAELSAEGSPTALITADPDGSHERVLSIRRRTALYFLAMPVNAVAQQPAWSPNGATIALVEAAINLPVKSSLLSWRRIGARPSARWAVDARVAR